MSRRSSGERQGKLPKGGGVSLKDLASHLNLSTTTLSVVLSGSPKAESIPKETQDRIFSAALEFNYRPNYLARSLRVQRTHTLGVLVPELSDGYSAMVLSGVEAALSGQGFFYLTASHLHHDDLLKSLPHVLIDRQVEGIIAVDTPIRFDPLLPVVSIAGHDQIDGVTNVILDHQKAAELGIGHLHDLGHRKIAVIKGQDFSSDTTIRWETILAAAKEREICIPAELTTQLLGDSPSPEVGYSATKELLARHVGFTALFAFNDVSAIGAIRAIREAGLRVPQDVSVLGFDDIYAAAFHNPALTTVKQPLIEMGKLAAETLLERLATRSEADIPEVLTVEPQLVVRDSTAPVATA